MGARRRRAVLAVVGALVAAAAASGSTPPVVSSSEIGPLRFGTPKLRAVKELTTLFGSPSRRFVSNGCGPNYSEVEWGHLYVEFRRGRLTGFRYLRAGWEGSAVTSGSADELHPKLATTEGVSLGSTIREARARYGMLKLIGADRWQTRDGLVFSISYTARQPPPASSRITEIKFGTCGDW